MHNIYNKYAKLNKLFKILRHDLFSGLIQISSTQKAEELSQKKDSTQENLPEKMRECIRNENYEEAVKICLSGSRGHQEWNDIT